MAASNASSPVLRQLKIKAGAVKRLVKDKQGYLVEAEEQRRRIEELRQSDAHPTDIRKQNEVLEESLMMIPDTERRIRAAMQDLENLANSGDPALANTPELNDALEAIVSAKAALPQ
ncbi:tubulin binding cofactor A [Martensiomyces pterosporus]|nr:tubulin binding cofactor A [Martensiomyces pterosporus]